METVEAQRSILRPRPLRTKTTRTQRGKWSDKSIKKETLVQRCVTQDACYKKRANMNIARRALGMRGLEISRMIKEGKL